MGQADSVPAARGASYVLLALAVVLVALAGGCGSDGAGSGPRDDQAAEAQEGDAGDVEEEGSDDEPSDEQLGAGPVDVLFVKRFECGETFDAATDLIEEGASGELLAELRLTRAVSGLCAGIDPTVLEADSSSAARTRLS